MDTDAALDAFGAIAQRTRLDALRLLVRAGEPGMAAGEISRALDVPHNTMSAHLSVLFTAGLVTSERLGRTILYRARYDALRDLIAFLMRDCCAGTPDILRDVPRLAAACLKGECV